MLIYPLMACPYFYPVMRSQNAAVARAPLGDLYDGHCQAEPSAPMHEGCNFGYGRGGCDHFPGESQGDAVRFSMSAGKLLYIIERNCSPIEHGAVDSAQISPAIRRQAEVFVENWKQFV
jgi:hypothetical protein